MKVLIPFDFSNVAVNAVNYALALLKEQNATFVLLNIYEGYPSRLLGDDYNEDWFETIDDTIEDGLKAVVQHYQKTTSKAHQFTAITRVGELIEGVQNTVTNEGVAIIVTGTKGAKGLSEIFIGTHTVKMINAITNCPIFVVPKNYTYMPLHQITFSTNFKRPSSKEELHFLMYLCQLKNVSLEIVSLIADDVLSDKQVDNKVRLQAILGSITFWTKKIDWDDSETKTIEAHIKETKSELLVLVNHKHNFFYKLTEEDVVQKSAFHSEIPLLILPSKF